MDPNACLKRLFKALDENDFAEAVQAYSDLLDWVLAGGASPLLASGDRDKLRQGAAQIADALNPPACELCTTHGCGCECPCHESEDPENFLHN